MEKTFKKVSHLKEGSYLLIDGIPSKVKGIDKSKAGRHGSTKARISAFGIFDSQKRQLLKPMSAEVEVPIIKRGNAQVVAVMGETIQIMDLKSYDCFNVQKPKEMGGLKSGVELEYIKYGEDARILKKRQSD